MGFLRVKPLNDLEAGALGKGENMKIMSIFGTRPEAIKFAPLIKEFKSHLHKGGAVCIADLEREDGSFHTHGNEGVEHFGFEPKELISLFEKEGFKLICHKRVFIIKKAKEYPIFLVCFYLA